MENLVNKKIRVIITGATGMVGEGVLHECILHDEVEQILVINRRPCEVVHPKLKEIIHTNFFDLSAIENELVDYDACFFCLGVSSVGMKEPDYFNMTYRLTMNVAQTLSRLNTDMVFCYVSGAGTDSTEKGKMMWARVKGKTENDLMKLPFKRVYNFRPAVIQSTKGLKRTLSYYKYFSWLMPILKIVAPNSICTLKSIGVGMIHAATTGFEKQILEVKDFRL